MRSPIPLNHPVLILIGIFILAAPLFDGLFAPVEFLLPVMIFLLFILYEDFRGKRIIPNPLVGIGIAYVMVYFVVVIKAIDTGQAIIEAYRYLLPFLVLLVTLRLSSSHITFLYRLIFISGGLVAIFGLTTLGTDFFIAGGMRADRLQSGFSYANTTAIYLLVALLFGFNEVFSEKALKRAVCLGGVYLCGISTCGTD
ncbi:MAG: hypothetical protein GX295_05050 [Syntrophomonadaceae bacterium]|nr:hypothetical protein [Syntrophomonadaceae bacterium]